MPRKYRKIASGGHVKAKRITGCEICNFSETYSKGSKLKTGSYCPRCNNPTVRIFDSKTEFERAQVLKSMRDNGEITDLEFQPVFPLHAHQQSFDPNRTPVHLYDFVADFAYNQYHEGSNSIVYVVEDVKGESRGKPVITDVAKMKIAHFEGQYGIPVRITTK